MINEWLIESPIRESAMFALHVMPALLLQKPSKSSKSKDHVDVLKRRLEKLKNREFLQLLREATTLQSRLPKRLERLKTLVWYQESFMNILAKEM